MRRLTGTTRITGKEIDKSQGIATASFWGFLAQGFEFPSLPRASDYICKLGLSLLVLVRVESDPVRNQKQPDTEGRAALRKAQLCPRPAESEAHGSTSLSVCPASFGEPPVSGQPSTVALWALENQLRSSGLRG